MGFSEAVDKYFHISERGSTIATEIKAGVATFLTMSYILLVNPQILGTAGLPVPAVVTATALTSTLSSLTLGLMANLPMGMSPGMGLNAYLVFSQVLGMDVPVNAALAGCLVAAGLVAVLAVIHALRLILAAVPDAIKLATVVGMGLLLTFIGLQTAKIVVPDPDTLVTLGNLTGLQPVLAILGLALISSLHYRNVRGSIILGILATAIAYFTIKEDWPHHFVALPHLQVFKMDFSQLRAPFNSNAWGAVVAYTLVMTFDIGGALFGLGALAGLVQQGQLPGATVAYLAAAAGTAIGAVTGTTPLIIAAESAVGIKEGGRTGLVAVTVSMCFLASMFLAPLFQAIPPVATAPVLVLVGAMMMGESVHIDWSTMLTAVPAFLTIVIQPFTFSIANGIYAGLVMSLLLFILTGTFLDYFKELMGYAKKPNGLQEVAEPLLEAMEEAPIDSGAAAIGIVPVPNGTRSSTMAVPAAVAGSVGRRGGSGGGAFVGSVTRNTPYERGSFSMYINTFGSQDRGGLLGGQQMLGTPQSPATDDHM